MKVSIGDSIPVRYKPNNALPKGENRECSFVKHCL